MFQPASLKGDSPTPIDERLRNRYLFLYIIIILLSFIPCSLFEYWYFINFWRSDTYWIFLLEKLRENWIWKKFIITTSYSIDVLSMSSEWTVRSLYTKLGLIIIAYINTIIIMKLLNALRNWGGSRTQSNRCYSWATKKRVSIWKI